MTHGSCIGMLHKTKPKRIWRDVKHLRCFLTNVTAQTDKDLSVAVFSRGARFGVDSYAVMGYIQLASFAYVFISTVAFKKKLHWDTKLMARVLFRLVHTSAFHFREGAS